MSYSNGKISGAVSVYDVQRALGVSSDDAATLCTSNKINKWAKYKPVHCANSERKFGRLIEHDYEVQNINAGQHSGKTTYYGLQIVTKPGVLSVTIHDNDYLYIGGPAGTASSPYRLQDFAGPSVATYGYDINAVPNIYGDMFDEKPIWSNKIPICARVSYKGYNSTGINLFAMTGNGYDEYRSSFQPNAFYVCVMKSLVVNGSILSSSWRVLYRNSNVPDTTVEPSGAASSPLNDSSSDFSNYFYTNVPADSAGDYKITFFIASKDGIDTNYSGAKSGWQRYEGETLQRTNPIPIPGLIGRNLTIESHDSSYDVELSYLTLNRDPKTVTALGSTATDGSGGGYTAYLKINNHDSITGEISNWRDIGISYTFNVTWDLKGIYAGDIPSGTYNYTITIYYSKSGNSFIACTESGTWNI